MGSVHHRLLSVACVGAVACTLNFDRYEPGATASADGGRDAASETGPLETGTADSSSDSGVDAADDGATNPCPEQAGTIAAPEATGVITIDGNLDDWGGPVFTLVEPGNAGLILGPNGTCTASNAASQCLVPNGETAEIALLRDSANLYVGVHVTVPSVGGTSTTAPYLNDAVEIYLRGDAQATGNYTSIDHQYVIDWQNQVFDYGPTNIDNGQQNPAGVTSAVKVDAGNVGYVLEAKIALSALGQSALTPGQKLGFDFGVDHGQGTGATRSLLVWWMATHSAPTCSTAKCTSCNPDQPYCDTLDFGFVCAG